MFSEKLSENKKDAERQPAGLNHLRIAIITPANAPVSSTVSHALSKLTHAIVSSGGTVVVPLNSQLVVPNSDFCKNLLENPTELTPTLSYGQHIFTKPGGEGFHVMETSSDCWVETLSGLGGTGIELMVTVLEGSRVRMPTPGHPMFPLLRVLNSIGTTCGTNMYEGDLVLTDHHTSQNESESVLCDIWYNLILDLVVKTASCAIVPKSVGNNDFQISRGPLGISM